MRNQLALLTVAVSILCAGSAAHAQQRPYDITNCDGDDSDKVIAAVNAAVERLDQIRDAPADVYNAIFTEAFGAYGQDDDGIFAYAIVGTNQLNTRVLLAGGQAVNPFGDPPTLQRLVFNCIPQQVIGDPARKVSANQINLYPSHFMSPFIGQYTSVQASQVGTVLHETLHILGGPMDLQFNGNSQTVQAEQLALAKDPRALQNAENYESFYMTFIF